MQDLLRHSSLRSTLASTHKQSRPPNTPAKYAAQAAAVALVFPFETKTVSLSRTNLVIVGPDYFRIADDSFRMQN